MTVSFRQYGWIIDAAVIVISAFFLAKITNVYLGQFFEVKRSIGVLTSASLNTFSSNHHVASDYMDTVKRNVFDSSVQEIIPEASSDVEKKDTSSVVEIDPMDQTPVETSLSLNIVSVLVVGIGKDSRSSVTIGGGGGSRRQSKKKSRGRSKNKVYAVGVEGDESFAPSTKLLQVLPRRIIFLNNNRLEYAEFDPIGESNIFGPPKYDDKESTASTQTPSKKKAEDSATILESGNKFTVDRRELDSALGDMNKLLTQIRAVPIFKNGKMDGLKVMSVQRSSIFSRLGLKRGDILKQINGQELNIAQGMQMFNQLKSSDSISLDLIRKGQPTTLDYDIR